MNAFARIESACARIVEEAFARIFPSALEPAQVGRKLIAVMQASPSDIYLVRVHPDDYANFERDRDFLEARWSALLRENLPPGRSETPRAILKEDASVVAGSLAIDALIDDRPQRLALETPGGRFALRAGLTLGRAADNDVVLADMRVSRRHAQVEADGPGFAIADLGSSNGTFVDGEPVRRKRLAAGNVVGLGDTLVTVVADDG